MVETVKYTSQQMADLRIYHVVTAVNWKERLNIAVHFNFVLAEELSWLLHVIGNSTTLLWKCKYILMVPVAVVVLIA